MIIHPDRIALPLNGRPDVGQHVAAGVGQGGVNFVHVGGGDDKRRGLVGENFHCRPNGGAEELHGGVDVVTVNQVAGHLRRFHFFLIGLGGFLASLGIDEALIVPAFRIAF